jgi:hypothetical protein
MIDVVQLVGDGHARYEWHYVTTNFHGHHLRVAVLRDAMKFDSMPAMNWHREPKVAGPDATTEMFDGVRLPASAFELQQIADMVGAMLLTPKLVDAIWLQAEVRFDAIVNDGPPKYTIVADLDVTAVHKMLQKAAIAHGDDGTKLVSCVGKYWVLVNELADGMAYGEHVLYGTDTACNYGWCSNGVQRAGVTAGVHVWQRQGFKHPKTQIDPSQTIRLMYREAMLLRKGAEAEEAIDLRDVAADADLCGLITHDGKPLRYLRQANVPTKELLGTLVLPPVTIEAEVGLGQGPSA